MENINPEKELKQSVCFSGNDYKIYMSQFTFTPSFSKYQRRKTRTVHIGEVPLGSDYPIRIQSMTTTDTMDTAATVAQSIRMIEAGCEYIRITAPSIHEAKNLELIRKELRARGYHTPLIADIHFTPNAAELAARLVEKVRINPGNYADKKKFEQLEYTDTEYAAEIERIHERFVPLVRICKEYGTAMRIGTNHGSLSDRILSRYGDTPEGMVESAMEFLEICRDEQYHNIVLSMKASNVQIMVQAYRLLVERMNASGMDYPLHVGVTEAGDGEDGRTKSAVGIGTLLEDGIGDTVRVSLTEDPEFEAPVARKLVERYTGRTSEPNVTLQEEPAAYHPFSYQRRETSPSQNFGKSNVPRVIADLSHLNPITEFDLKQCGHLYDATLDKWHMSDQGADYIFCGQNMPAFMLPNGLKGILEARTWSELGKPLNYFPLFTEISNEVSDTMNFLEVTSNQITSLPLKALDQRWVLVFKPIIKNTLKELRQMFWYLKQQQIHLPVVLRFSYQTAEEETQIIDASTDAGSLLTDGYGDGIWLSNPNMTVTALNRLSFGILQACRTRISKTEYISCPSCGRTLFDLQETTAMIRSRTDHLKGIKIGIMGCIVNGPGEMADADYGYVGSGPGKITLYRGKEVVKRNIPSEGAVDELIGLIASDGNWIEKN